MFSLCIVYVSIVYKCIYTFIMNYLLNTIIYYITTGLRNTHPSAASPYSTRLINRDITDYRQLLPLLLLLLQRTTTTTTTTITSTASTV